MIMLIGIALLIVSSIMFVATIVPAGLAMFPVLADIPVPPTGWAILFAVGVIIVMMNRRARD